MSVHLITGDRRPDIDEWLTACGRWVQSAYATPGTIEVTCRACRGTYRYTVRVGYKAAR